MGNANINRNLLTYKLPNSAGVEASPHQLLALQLSLQSKPPDRIVHLFNLHSASRTNLAYGGILCSSCRQLFGIPLRCSHLPVQSRHCHARMAIKSCAFRFKPADKYYMSTCVPIWSATILGIHLEESANSPQQTKAVSRTQHYSSIVLVLIGLLFILVT